MTNEQTREIAEAIHSIVHGPVTGTGSQPMGIEALTMAIGGQGEPGRNDSVASGLHDIAGAIRELAEAIQSRQ
jgi:hypothetical protein